MLAGWLEAYAEFMELNVWTGTEFTSAVRRLAGRIACRTTAETTTPGGSSIRLRSAVCGLG
jgi:hypothetical protein